MTSVRYYGKWLVEAERSHMASVLSWGFLSLYMVMKLMDTAVDTEYNFPGIGSGELCLLCAGLGLAFSLIEFFYLFQSKKLDFYYSLPVKKSAIFWSRYAHGLMQFLLPLLLTQTICTVYAAVKNQRFAVYAGAYLGRSAGVSLLVFLVFYHTGILAASVSGKLVTVVAAAAVILVYFQILIQNIFIGFAEEIYRHYYRIPIFEEALELLAPVRLVQNLMGLQLTEAQEVWRYIPGGRSVLSALVWIVLLLVLAVTAHRTRKTEMAGRVFTSALAERVTEAAVSLLAGLWTGNLLIRTTPVKESGMAAMVILLCVSGIAGACVPHFLTESLVRTPGCTLWRRRRQMLAEGVCAGITACIFLGNKASFDSYLPDCAQLEKMAVSVNGVDMKQRQYVQLMNEESGETEERLQRYSLSGRESIEAGLAWVQEALEVKDADITTAAVCYYLKDGGRRYRTYPLDQEALDSFSQVYETEEYKKRAYPLTEVKDIRKGQIIWSDGVTDSAVRLSAPEKDALLAAYCADVAAMRMEELKTAYPAGSLEIISEADGIHMEAMVYPFFERTCKVLKDAGTAVGKTLADYQITSIKVQASFAAPEGYTGGVSVRFYEEKEETGEWAEKLIPEELAMQPLLCPADVSVRAEAEVEDENIQASTIVKCFKRR